MGVIINMMFGKVTLEKLENYYILIFIQTCFALTPLFIIKLIPMKSEMQDA